MRLGTRGGWGMGACDGWGWTFRRYIWWSLDISKVHLMEAGCDEWGWGLQRKRLKTPNRERLETNGAGKDEQVKTVHGICKPEDRQREGTYINFIRLMLLAQIRYRKFPLIRLDIIFQQTCGSTTYGACLAYTIILSPDYIWFVSKEHVSFTQAHHAHKCYESLSQITMHAPSNLQQWIAFYKPCIHVSTLLK